VFVASPLPGSKDSTGTGHLTLPLPLVAAIFQHCPPFVAARLLRLGLRGAGLRIGKTSHFWGWPQLVGDHQLMSVGEHCGFNVRCYFELEAPITFGDHVSVGHEVMFLTKTFDAREPSCRATAATPQPIVVGDGAWIGARATILPGVTIGAGAVISAAAVVSSDVPPHTLLSGKRKISLAKWR
jgi:maltose O-acetyltransferase